LVSPVYFGNGAVCPKLSNQRIDIDTEMNACFEIETTQNDFEGALLFGLERCSNWYNMDTSTTETNKNKTPHVHILAIWKVKDSKPFVRVVLVEHTREFTWNEDKLRKLYDKNFGWLKEYNNPMSDTWLMNSNVVLRISFKVKLLKENFELNISISEEEKDDYVMKPLYVDLER
jgi:hypothetical protein